MKESYLQARACGQGRPGSSSTQRDMELAAMRFYAALMLDELIHESPVWTVAEKYISPNYLLALIQ